MPRQLVSRTELVRIINDRMEQLRYGKDCSLGGVLRLPHPDRDGCNWMAGVIGNRCRSALQDVVAKARLEFNLFDE
jgi:hypothetical protein